MTSISEKGGVSNGKKMEYIISIGNFCHVFHSMVNGLYANWKIILV
jgi:hypothetical protein